MIMLSNHGREVISKRGLQGKNDNIAAALCVPVCILTKQTDDTITAVLLQQW
jgi:hypothetical protein